MPRRARIAFAGYPHHLVQRGHNRSAVFFSDFDRLDYLGTLRECREMYSLKVYGYCLMTNHVHLIVDPGAHAQNVGRLMKRLAGRHTRRMNSLLRKTGTVWEGRFHCSPIDTTRYLLTCGKYVDQNPVRAGIVVRPEDFRWSSYRARAGYEPCEWLDEDPALADLAETRERRFSLYRTLAGLPASEDELSVIRGALQRNQLTGQEEFRTEILRTLGVDVPGRTRGRPRAKEDDGRYKQNGRLAAPVRGQK